MLELYKQGLVELEQATNFAELHITWLGTEATPTPSPVAVFPIEEYQG